MSKIPKPTPTPTTGSPLYPKLGKPYKGPSDFTISLMAILFVASFIFACWEW